jgi:MarR family transcriptional regulator, organic hydroperoxide resistance regulator
MVVDDPIADVQGASEALGRALKGAIAAVRRLRGRDTHRPGELGYAQYSLLFELSDRGEVSARELACAAALSPASVTEMLDQLADLGLVVRTRSALDRRIVVSRLSPSGRELVVARRARILPLWEAALAEFTAAELLAAAGVLERLREFFDALDAVA